MPEPTPTAISSPSADVDLCALPAIEMARLVRDRQVSPRELVRAHLDRIAQVEPKVSAFQVVRSEAALAEADAVAAHPRLRDLPLAGVPVAIKDNVDVAGEPTRLGSAATRVSPAAADDDLLVARLRAAGCVVIGKTALPELAIWPVTEPAAFAPTRNPWDLRKAAGGSTGGGAAAVVSGMAALALGSDGGGSLRIPAACCGVFGFKPGRGVVPVAGQREQHWLGLTEYGPIARTVDDAALMLDVLAGRAVYRDPRPLDHPVTIAFSGRHPLIGVKASSRVISELDEVAALLRNAGHSLRADSPPYPLTLGLRFNSRWLSGIAQDAAGLDFEALEPRTQAMVKVGRFLSKRAKPASADPYGRRVARWFGDYEALITPTLTGGPGPVGAWAGAGWFATMLKSANWIYTPPWNLAGLPAASVPFGHDDDGLPIGIQLIGPAGSEGRLLSLAARIEQLRPWLRTVPGAPG
ncbi:MAG TPA: amidase family protein [Streptosporangiaceae bacterium]|nr:amidase family protein [Streptosporangiaceae bacterium]